MIFTTISIFVSVFEYQFSSKAIKSDTVMIVRFDISSQQMANMRRSHFSKQIIFRHHKLIHYMAKIMQINARTVERLMPLQVKNGAIFSFIVEFEDMNEYTSICTEINRSVSDGTLAKVCKFVVFFSFPCSVTLLLIYQQYRVSQTF